MEKGNTDKGRTQVCHLSCVHPLRSADFFLFIGAFVKVRSQGNGTSSQRDVYAGNVLLISLK